MANLLLPRNEVPDEGAVGHEAEENDDDKWEEGRSPENGQGKDGLLSEFVLPHSECREENDGDDQKGDLVWGVPSCSGSLAIKVSRNILVGIWDAYFQTKLNAMRPLMPSNEPTQSIGSDLPGGSSGGSNSARLPKTINPNRDLIASGQPREDYSAVSHLHKDKQPFPRRKLGQEASKQGT